MLPRVGRGVSVLTLALFALGNAGTANAQTAVIKVAYFNIQSGKGEPGLPGHATPFTDTSNCTDSTQPMNGWGVGFVQKELLAKLSDPSVVALGLEEAWVCGSPENVRKALGWKARTSEQNGVGLVARYGLAGPEQWKQLDTTMNPNPTDTMWALRVPVCLNAACSQSMPVYVAHWYGSGTYGETAYATQAQQTVAFIKSTTAAGEPHVFGGDLNVWEGTGVVCNQTPNNTALTYVRNAGYMDAWKTVNGGAEGYTGMTNRPGCGYPEGYAWRRIDYVWSQPTFLPIAMERFGVSPAGDPTPSDHYGIIATFPYPGVPSSSDPQPPSTTAGDIVLYAGRTTTVKGSWQVVSDATAAGGFRVGQKDAGLAKVATAAAAPANYFELTFTPQANVAYHLWVRGKAQYDSYANDSAYLQFSGSLTSTGQAAYRIGTTSAVGVNLEDGSGVGVSGWGWQDNGYGVNVLGPALYFDGKPQTLRVQTREDGFSIDQIVLSPVQYASKSPGALKNDTVILAETAAPPPPPVVNPSEVVIHANSATVVAGTFKKFAATTAADNISVGTLDASLAKVASASAAPVNYVEFTFDAKARTAYRLWIRGRAQNDDWANDSVHVQFSNAVDGSGAPVYRIGTTSSTVVNLEDASGAGVSGWGWQDNGYGTNVLGPVIYFAADGTQTLRVQVREDGYTFDQIVLSSQKYLTTAPGALKNDATIIP